MSNTPVKVGGLPVANTASGTDTLIVVKTVSGKKVMHQITLANLKTVLDSLSSS